MGVEKSLIKVAVADRLEEAAISETADRMVVVTELLELVTGEPKLVGLLPKLDAVPGDPGFPMGRLLGSPPIVPPEEPAPGEKELPGLVISGLLVVLLAEAGTLTVALAELGPLEEPVAVTLVLAEVAPGTNTV